MKELSIEQKAKRYDVAIETARKINSGEGVAAPNDWTICEVIFPELKDSDDEKIKKWLIELVEEVRKANPTNVEHNGMCSRALAWLEKQKTSEEALQYLKENHSPSEVSDFQAAMNIAVAKAYDKGYNDGLKRQGEHANFCNKIQIGDKVTRNRDGYLVNLSQLNRVAKVDEKQGEQKPDDNIDSSSFKDKLLKLFQKFRYIKEGMPTNGDIIDYVDAHIQELIDTIQNKPAWSEEDEEKMNWIIATLNNCSMRNSECLPMNESCEDWLKSLRPRNTWKPSDLQMEALDSATENCAYSEYQDCLRELQEQLKKLKE